MATVQFESPEKLDAAADAAHKDGDYEHERKSY